jgi:L-ectoine synthase
MIVKKLDELEDEGRVVSGETWVSKRLLLKKEGMGFSMHDTTLHEGTETHMHYKNHLEAVYCIEGRATIEEVDNGKVHTIEPGTVYALNEHDKHILRVQETFRAICVFNPPLVGPETHGPDGAYPLLE